MSLDGAPKSKEQCVSIIMPLYNCESFVLDSIKSVIEQSYGNWELIIVDDMSTDDSYIVTQAYVSGEPRIKLHQLSSNSGAAAARNYAIELAQGRYIAFIDSDDIWFPTKLEEQILFLNMHNLVLTYSAYETMDENSIYINTRHSLPFITYKDMLKSNQIGNLTGIYDVDYFGKVYLENIGHEDYVLWLKLLKKIQYTKGLPQTLARYRIVSNSISANKIKALRWQWNIYRKVEKLTILQSSYYSIFYIYNALRKRS